MGKRNKAKTRLTKHRRGGLEWTEDDLGRKQGELLRFHNSITILREHYVDNLLHGMTTRCDYFGNRTATTTYVNGELHGRKTMYMRDGRVKAVRHFYFGKLHGELVTYIGTNMEHAVYDNGFKIHGLHMPLSEEDKFELALKYEGLQWA